jgi:uncharacterized protein (DUF1499 family)
MMTLSIGLVVLAAAIVAVVRIADRGADAGLVDFASLARRGTPNEILACPIGLCHARAEFVTDPVTLSADALAAKVLDLPSREPRTVVAARNDSGRAFVLVQRSALFNFPDTVNIAVQSLDATHATLAIYSRSNYGRGDFGVNLARVKRWLDLLGVPYHPSATS